MGVKESQLKYTIHQQTFETTFRIGVRGIFFFNRAPVDRQKIFCTAVLGFLMPFSKQIENKFENNGQWLNILSKGPWFIVISTNGTKLTKSTVMLIKGYDEITRYVCSFMTTRWYEERVKFVLSG